MALSFPKLDSNSGALSYVLNNLDSQLKVDGEATVVQKSVAKVTAFVAVFFAAVIDTVMHTVLAAAWLVPTALNVTIGRLTGLDKHMPNAFTGCDWTNQVANIHGSITMALNALVVGWRNEAALVSMGRSLNLVHAPVAGKAEGGTPAVAAS